MAFVAWLGLSCGPDDVVEECIPVEEVGVSQQWCDAPDIYSPELTWDGPAPARAEFVCLPPDDDGECELCGPDELGKAVEGGLREKLLVAVPECDLERWEVHCMRTVEYGMVFGGPNEYCCYEIAVWGENCDP